MKKNEVLPENLEADVQSQDWTYDPEPKRMVQSVTMTLFSPTIP
jgi:hypothetical protein